jgi:signal recognition particle GTPase
MIDDSQMYEVEKRIKRSETIVSAMTEEERNFPDLIALNSGKRELVNEATVRRMELAERAKLSLKEVETFVNEFVSMRKMMREKLKTLDFEAMQANPKGPMTFKQKVKKVKPTRGGGMGFGGK